MSNMVSSATNTVVRSIRDLKPVHYTLKIQSFSFLKDAIAASKPKRERYESPEFEVGGYKWKLALYPDGDNTRDGSGHISLYLTTVEKDIISSNSQVYVLFTLFVYDHLNDTYLTIQDGKARCFHTLKTEWGFPQLLSHETFNDVSNGFLVNDCCVFGVKIFVIKSEAKRDVFSLIKEPENNKHIWKLENFSKLDEDYRDSELFTVEGYIWNIRLHPKGDSRVKGQDYLSLFLQLENVKELPPGCQVFLEFEISIKKKVGPSFHQTFNCWYSSDAQSWSNPKFIALQDLIEPTKGYIVNDVLIIKAKINAISTLESFS